MVIYLKSFLSNNHNDFFPFRPVLLPETYLNGRIIYFSISRAINVMTVITGDIYIIIVLKVCSHSFKSLFDGDSTALFGVAFDRPPHSFFIHPPPL